MVGRFGMRTGESVLGVVTALGLCSFALVIEAEERAPALQAEAPPSDASVPEPPSVASENGVLAITLTAKPASVEVAGKTFKTNVYNGLYIPPHPELAGLKRRTFIFKDLELPGSGDEDDVPKTKTINGVLGGVVQTQPGSLELWELGNIGADSYIDFALDGHKVWVLERDGNALAKPELTDHVFLPPSSRAEIVVEAGAAGDYAIRSRAVETGAAGDPNPDVVLATLKVAGDKVDGSALRARLEQPAVASTGHTAAEIEAMPVTRQRRLVYTENEEGTEFYLNGKQFDMERIDAEVKLGDVEEWTLVNDSDERHTFHIHQVEFLVQSVGDNPLETPGVRDNVDIPFRDPTTKEPGVVKVKIPFTNPVIVGKFPYHCHILEHEDGGMMQNLRVVP